MPGTDFGRAVPHIWHKKIVELDLADGRSSVTWAGTSGTWCDGFVYGLVFAPKAVHQHTNWVIHIPPDWDGTSHFILRYQWAQYPIGDQSTDACYWDIVYWAAQDWDNVLGSKFSSDSATYTYGDEGTSNYAMHCGTFEMNLTGGTFGTVSPGHMLFIHLAMPQGVSGAATASLFRASVEYMAHVTGPSDAVYDTLDKRGG